MPIIKDMTYLRNNNPRVFRKYDAELHDLSSEIHRARLREEDLRRGTKIMERSK